MSSLVDSEAQFGARALEVGLSQTVVDAIKLAGVRTLSNLAFAIGQPGQPIANTDVDSFLQSALGRDATLAETNATRRLAFEAQTLVIVSLRQVVDQRDDTVPRKVGAAERETRMRALKAAVVGIQVSGEHEPSHNLLDKVCAMFEQNSVKYFEPCQCISRTAEVQGTTKTKELAFEHGALVVRDPSDKTAVPIDSEIKLHYAMIRRGLAFHFGRVMHHDQHMTWQTFLFDSLHREAPPGYSKPSLHKIIQCDKAAWGRLASLGVSVRQQADGTFPLGEALLQLRQDPSIVLHLSPLAKAKESSVRPGPYDVDDRWNKGKGKHDKKGKGKGKTKNKSSPPMPPWQIS